MACSGHQVLRLRLALFYAAPACCFVWCYLQAQFTKLRSICVAAEQGMRSLGQRLSIALEAPSAMQAAAAAASASDAAGAHPGLGALPGNTPNSRLTSAGVYVGVFLRGAQESAVGVEHRLHRAILTRRMCCCQTWSPIHWLLGLPVIGHEHVVSTQCASSSHTLSSATVRHGSQHNVDPIMGPAPLP